MARFLRVAQWNANGLHPHIYEVKLFLKHNYIDVLLISETHCTDRTYCSIPHYNIRRCIKKFPDLTYRLESIYLM
jgi:hypothetical protein